MAIAGANYEVMMFDLGEYGRKSDGGIWASSDLRKEFKTEKLKHSSSHLLFLYRRRLFSSPYCSCW